MPPAHAQDTARCALVAPKYASSAGKASFEITIDCETAAAHAKPFPVDVDILVGLTVYSDVGVDEKHEAARVVDRRIDAASDIQKALKGAAKSRSVIAFRGPKWIILVDSSAESFDIPAQVIRIPRGTKRLPVRFQAQDSDIAGKQHLLFAAWPAADRRPCNARDEYARSGCKRDGYVIGDGHGVAPIAAYPGLEHFETVDSATERWIVERFR